MNKIEKPAFLNEVDWKIIKEKYPNNLSKIVKKLQNHYPVQYIIGNVDFYNSMIIVNKNVLIPRFETERLIEKLVKKFQNQKMENKRVIDLGTGSGCIAISLQKEWNCQMTAIDISSKAIRLAKKNAINNHVKIEFKKQPIEKVDLENYDIIISNPPYVRKKEPVGEEIKYEPQKAIFAKQDGLYFYEIILKKVADLKNKPTLIAFEIGAQQGLAIKHIAKKYLKKYKIIIEKDYTEKDRFVFITKNE